MGETIPNWRELVKVSFSALDPPDTVEDSINIMMWHLILSTNECTTGCNRQVENIQVISMGNVFWSAARACAVPSYRSYWKYCENLPGAKKEHRKCR